MTERAFRFGVIAAQARTGAEWAANARRAEELGYDTLLIPDTLVTLSPFAALAAAAAATRTLRVGTYVLNAPNRTAAQVAWETRSLQTISDGRFELGVGGGRPGGHADTAALGGLWGTPGERLRRTADTIAAARGLPMPPTVLVAASKPGMMRLAAEQADVVTFGLPPVATPGELARAATEFRGLSNRADQVELLVGVTAFAPTIFALPAWLSRQVGGDPREMAAAGAATFLIGDADHAAEELLRRRAAGGFSYFAVNGPFMEAFAPVIQRLRGTGPVGGSAEPAAPDGDRRGGERRPAGTPGPSTKVAAASRLHRPTEAS
ncbi:hypothetical protein ACWT_6783 [Actinoplanes sp. SE50]|uniref:LLM class flavin-dependent oxidoreductase n=1 Tax=unclassified Actinoplanes TaxID=2626549 RepID=UPI00023ECF74|nr:MULTISPECIES: LLM class flavin-dependent oxidoreductase [unclassified Actinoplanes]AEV87796.1 hypothetical protein ACPL_6914 [Actinoplanes sp. SE50/110]ATO86198.1 hypothetical protein ACWT_6783 [Actinoplanes sp. SE50]SLM03612.1 uncharacterized protein ACSP50_6905 [Actinoplanes sp. SE50/110]